MQLDIDMVLFAYVLVSEITCAAKTSKSVMGKKCTNFFVSPKSKEAQPMIPNTSETVNTVSNTADTNDNVAAELI